MNSLSTLSVKRTVKSIYNEQTTEEPWSHLAEVEV